MRYDRRVFSAYTPEDLTTLARALFASANSSARPTVRFKKMQPSELTIAFSRAQAIEFTCPEQFASAERRDFFTNRWLACWPLFAAVKQIYPLLQGTCTLWVDDFARGPGLAFCGKSVGQTLIPDPVFFETNAYEDLRDYCTQNWISWQDRSSTCFWRGASTGIREHLRVVSWRDIPRVRLCLAASSCPEREMFDVAISHVVQIHDRQELEEMAQSGLVKAERPLTDFMSYRFSIDIDGNTCSWPGLFTKLIMGVTTIKVESIQGWRQWYYDRLIPWKNFVPLSESMEDITQVLIHLRAHPREAEEIAYRGTKLVAELTMNAVIEEAARSIYDLLSR